MSTLTNDRVEMLEAPSTPLEGDFLAYVRSVEKIRRLERALAVEFEVLDSIEERLERSDVKIDADFAVYLNAARDSWRQQKNPKL